MVWILLIKLLWIWFLWNIEFEASSVSREWVIPYLKVVCKIIAIRFFLSWLKEYYLYLKKEA